MDSIKLQGVFMLFFKEKINYDIVILKNICKKLPDKYNYIKKQVDEGIISGLEKDKRNNFRQLKFDVNLLNKYENKKYPEFSIENIILKHKKSNENITASIFIAYGLLIGYDININSVSEIDLENIDMDNIKEKHSFDESIKKSSTTGIAGGLRKPP
ncbi:MAG: hypothetical protein LBD18_01025 [Treponema sp.]|jgi:hypothetical protein|nr:hypothetical protein [Treponema sp.]